MKKKLSIISIGVGIVGGLIIALKGRIPDDIAGATVFILLGIYLYKNSQKGK